MRGNKATIWFRRIVGWVKYERLQHYPALSVFSRREALKRLKAYEREEREACQPWLTLSWLFVVASGCGLIALVCYKLVPDPLGILTQVPAWAVQYVLYRRIRRRVQAKVAAELRDGRLPTCLKCGYDLRGSQKRCPECGTDFPSPHPAKLP